MEKFLAYDGVGFLFHEVGDLIRDPNARLALMSGLTLILGSSGVILRNIWNSAGVKANVDEGMQGEQIEIQEPEIIN